MQLAFYSHTTGTAAFRLLRGDFQVFRPQGHPWIEIQHGGMLTPPR